MRLTKLLAFALLPWTPAVHPTPTAVNPNLPVVVGWVEELTCPSDYYQLTRQGVPSPLPVEVLMQLQAGDTLALKPNMPFLQSKKTSYAQLPVTIKDADTQLLCNNPALFQITPPRQGNTLQVGDRVSINPEASILSIRLNGQPTRKVKYHELAYQVTTDAVTPIVADNFLTQLSSWFTKQHDELLRVLVGRAGESEKPRINVLNDNKQQLVAGDRDLFIAWHSGKPPFTVTITGAGKSQPYSNLSQRQLQTKVTLTPGAYRLTLQDDNQQTTSYTFKVVTSHPRPPQSQRLQNLADDSLRWLAQRLCIAVQDKGVWRFEAMQQAAQRGDSYAPALLLRDVLLRGTEIRPLDLTEGDCVE